jgi:hypothetical protein
MREAERKQNKNERIDRYQDPKTVCGRIMIHGVPHVPHVLHVRDA